MTSRIKWAGHVEGMDKDCLPKVAYVHQEKGREEEKKRGREEDRTSGGLFTGSREMPREAGLEDED